MPARQAKALEQAPAEGVSVVWGEQMQSPLSVKGRDLGAPRAFSGGGKGLKVRKGAPWKDNAIAVMDNLAPLFGVADAEQEFELKRVDTDKLGFNHVRLTQRHRGLRVMGADLIVHFDANGLAYEVNGEYAPAIDVDVKPKLTANAAIRIVRDDQAAMGFVGVEIAKDPELVVYAFNGATPRLAYELAASYKGNEKPRAYWKYWIDAVTGDVLLKYDDVKRIAPPDPNNGVPVTIRGNILEGEGGQSIEVEGWLQDEVYYLYNTSNLWMIYNLSPFTTIYSDADTYAFRMTSNWGTSDRAAMSVANNIDTTQRYFREVHNRNSYDNRGTIAHVNIHSPDDWDNASWWGYTQQMYIGDDSYDWSLSLGVLDIMAHEYTHAVTEHTADMIYSFESGALTESFSDIFASCVEFWAQPDGRHLYPRTMPSTADWLCGEDYETIRDLRNPNRFSQASRYKGTLWKDWGIGIDNGGVHYNGGPHAFLFYLLCEGGAGDNDGLEYDVPRLGIEMAEQIAYRVLTVYCTPSTGYAAIREMWYSATRDLINAGILPYEALACVRCAWDAIMGKQPPPQITTESPLPDGRVGNFYSWPFTAKSVSPVYSWSFVGGTPPPELAFTSAGRLSGLCTQSGSYTFSVAVEANSGQTATNTFDIFIRSPLEAPFHEDFEGDVGGPLAPLTGWSLENVSGGIGWRVREQGAYQKKPFGTPDGLKMSYLGKWDDGGTATYPDHVSRLVSPLIVFGPDARAAQLKFIVYMEKWTSLQDELRVYCKTNWYEPWGDPIATYTNSIYSWIPQVLDLPYPAAGTGFYVAFEGTALGGYGVCVDAIWVGDPIPKLAIITPTPLPVALAETNYPYSSPLVTLESEGGWLPGQGEYTYEIISGAMPSGFGLTPEGVVTGCCMTVQSGTFTVQVTDSEGRTATKVMTLLVELPRAPIFMDNMENQTLAGWTFKKENDAPKYNVSWQTRSNGGWDGKSPPFEAHTPLKYAILYGVPSGNDIVCVKMISPQFDLSQVPSNTRLSFWHFMQKDGSNQDQLRVYYRNVSGGTWNLITNYTENVTVWTHRVLNLPNLSSTYQIAFEGRVFGGYGVCVDTVSITDDAAAPVITSLPSLPGGFRGFPYFTALSAVGGVPPYLWSLVSGALPAGLTLSADGEIRGTPTVATTAAFQIAVTGADGRASTNAFSLRVLPPGNIPFVEKFDKPTLPDGWTIERYMGTVDWVFTKGTICYWANATPTAPPAGITSNACLWTANSGATIARLVSPPINLESLTSDATMTFQLHMAPYLSGRDQVTIRYRTNTVDTWKTITRLETPVTKWTPQTLTLPNPCATYYIAFEGQSMGGSGICVADLTIFGNVTQDKPFEIWRREFFTGAGQLENISLSGPDGDASGDGIPNLMKYATGLDPWTSNTVAYIGGGITNLAGHPGVDDGSYFFLKYRRAHRATDVEYSVFGTPSLTAPGLNWKTDNIVELLPWMPGAAPEWSWVHTIHLTPTTNAPQRFMRLNVELVP